MLQLHLNWNLSHMRAVLQARLIRFVGSEVKHFTLGVPAAHPLVRKLIFRLFFFFLRYALEGEIHRVATCQATVASKSWLQKLLPSLSQKTIHCCVSLAPLAQGGKVAFPSFSATDCVRTALFQLICADRPCPGCNRQCISQEQAPQQQEEIREHASALRKILPKRTLGSQTECASLTCRWTQIIFMRTMFLWSKTWPLHFPFSSFGLSSSWLPSFISSSPTG